MLILMLIAAGHAAADDDSDDIAITMMTGLFDETMESHKLLSITNGYHPPLHH